ncbi:switch-associated protein 70-like isoform X2 [Agrilus planipennis]|nr:switch-associated protein 70-like isoform X2 [Agrilus planipennis]
MASILGLYDLEQGLDHFRSTPGLNFDNYQYYLRKEVFSVVTGDKLSSKNAREYELKIARLCWLVCCRKYLTRKGLMLSEDSLFKLFVIFCMSSELKTKSGDLRLVTLHPSEAIHIAQTFVNSLGCTWDENEFVDVAISLGFFQFESFVAILETRCFGTIQIEEAVSEAITDLYETYVEDVVKKGYLLKKVNSSLPIMKEYWFVLKLSALEYFKSKNDKAHCGCMNLESGIEVRSKDGNRFLVKNSKRKVELQTKDPITRLQWLSALKIVNDNNSDRVRTTKGRIERQQRFDEQLRIQCDVYRREQTTQMKMIAMEESKRLNELEQLKENLERLLVEAREAKRGEEIVRSLQARVLAEEWERREELEKLQREQKERLEQEVSKRKECEGLRLEKELQLQAAQKLLHQLEEEKLDVDAKLQNALEKIQKIEQNKQLLQNKLVQVASFLEDGSKVRRTLSFMPTTKERPLILEIRAAATLMKS